MRVIYSEKSLKFLKKLDKPIQKMIVHYMEKVGQLEEPRQEARRCQPIWEDFGDTECRTTELFARLMTIN